MLNDEARGTGTIDMQVPVLIVGGAVVGLSMSLFLSRQGIPSLLVEKHPEPARLPRVRGIDARTMELFRFVGLEDIIRAAQSPTLGNRGIVRVESLVGREIVHLDEGGNVDLSAFSPASSCRTSQDRIEPILLAAASARQKGGDIRFNTELLSFQQDESGVSAIIRDRTTGYETRVRAQYLIAADGNRSGVRDTLGIRTEGPGTISYSTDIAFEADLQEALDGRRYMIFHVSNPLLPDGLAGLLPNDNQRHWSFGFPIHPERGERREDLTDERCIELIRLATGIPDLAVKILPAYPWDAVKVGVWELAARHADQYRKGRVFLAGDAAHAVLPTGGFGAGIGIQDAFNLAWKLALVLKGKAGVQLLDSYEAERLPIGKLIVEQTVQRYFYRTGMRESSFIENAELIFGFRYRSEAVLVEPGANDAPLTQDPTTLCGEPGTRAPHLVLARENTRISSIDLCIGNWTLLVGSEGNAWYEAAERVSCQLDFPLSIYTVGSGENALRDVEGRWDAAYGVASTGAVLVRPDGFIAWRSLDRVEDLQSALAQILGR
jgi:putative polyketide hydroxylase